MTIKYISLSQNMCYIVLLGNGNSRGELGKVNSLEVFEWSEPLYL